MIVDVGIYEMVNMASRFVGVTVVLIAPIKRIKLTYFVLLMFQVLAYLLICATHFSAGLFTVFFPIANVLIGLGTGLYMCPYLLLYQCFKSAEPSGSSANPSTEFEFPRRIKLAFNIWMGLGILGHAYALLLGKWMVDDLELDWVVSLFTFTMIYLLTGILTCVIVPEQRIEMEGEEADMTAGRKVCIVMKTLKDYYRRNASNALLLVEYSFVDNQGAMIVYWMAYFFMRVGFGFNAAWIALGYPIGAAIGSFTTSPLVNAFPSYAPLSVSIILFLVCICNNAFWFIEL